MQEKQSARTAFWVGIVFSLIFTLLIWWTGRFLDTSTFLPDQGASWYFWKLPNPTFWTRFSAWGFYIAHQISFWVVIYLAQKARPRFSDGLNKYAGAALAINAFFIVAHLIQTQIWYDGLAQDVSIWSSQISVIIMLVLILLMEIPRRGLFWGKKIPFSRAITSFVRRYHGYYIAWATIYTFWYHPMENTSGHLIGFIYMFFLLLQGSLLFTRVHINPWWTTFLEAFVIFHGTLVAIYQGNGLWPMFFFGFLGLFVITQMHGLKVPKWVHWVILAAYAVGVGMVYSQRGFDKLYELVSIPLIEYASVLVAGLVVWLILWAIGQKTSLFQRKE
jgi:hypothetical protein